MLTFPNQNHGSWDTNANYLCKHFQRKHDRTSDVKGTDISVIKAHDGKRKNVATEKVAAKRGSPPAQATGGLTDNGVVSTSSVAQPPPATLISRTLFRHENEPKNIKI